MKTESIIPNQEKFLNSSTHTHNLYGEHLANFIILPNLKNLPEELKEFDERGDATFASSKSGWQTRETFLYWTICFINALSIYRRKLPANISQEDALLIMDGHSSREKSICSTALSKKSHSCFDTPITHITSFTNV